MRQKSTVRTSSVWARRGVWLGWAIFRSLVRGDYDGPLRAVRSKRTSAVLLPSTALKRNSDRFVISDLHRDPVQSKEVATLGDDLPGKRYRRILFAPRTKENSEQFRTGERLGTLR